MDAKEKRKLHRKRMREEGKYSSRRKKKKKSSFFSTLVLIIALCVFAYSAWQLFKIFSSYKKGNDEYEKIQSLALNVEKTKDNPKVTVDFEKLRKINPDVVAWIRFDEPKVINYPVVHSKDNNEYLTKLFGEGKNTYGTLFVDKDNNGQFYDKNTFIYGHRMKSGSMFGKLEKYMKKDFYEKNPFFYIYTPDGKESKYEIFSAAVVKATSDSYQKSYSTPDDFAKYIENERAQSLYQTDVKVTGESQIVSLSTCTVDSNEDRFLVHAVKISER